MPEQDQYAGSSEDPGSIEDPIEDPGRLLSLVSHELRQPLTAALGSSLALSEPPDRASLDSGDRAVLLDIIRRNLHQLERQLDTLHIYGELRTGRLKADLVLVPLYELLNSCRDAFDPLRATLEVVVTCEPDIYVEVDTMLMHQVISNLLVNAKKFSPPGSTVILHGRESDSWTIISVRDMGPGIPDEERERVFEPGFSGDHSRGLGLGLYLCREIVRAHGGRIWVDTPKSPGTRVNIALDRPVLGGRKG